jgi:hypothetical protein
LPASVLRRLRFAARWRWARHLQAIFQTASGDGPRLGAILPGNGKAPGRPPVHGSVWYAFRMCRPTGALAYRVTTVNSAKAQPQSTNWTATPRRHTGAAHRALISKRSSAQIERALTQERPRRNEMRVSKQRDKAERPAKATVSASSAKPVSQKAASSTHGAADSEFVSMPECWLDRIRLGFPRANTW